MSWLQEYSQAEANTAFGRTNAAHGWGNPSHSSHLPSLPHQVSQASMPLLTTLQAAQAAQVAQATALSGISKLARTFHWTSPLPLPALPSRMRPPSAAAQPASSSLPCHSSPSLSERAGDAKRAKRGLVSISDMFVQLPALAYATAAEAAASSKTSAITNSCSTAYPPSHTQPARSRILFQMPNTVACVTSDGGAKAEGESISSSVAPAANDRQDQADRAQSPAAPYITGGGGCASENTSLVTIHVLSPAEREAGRKKRLAKEERALRVQLETQVHEEILIVWEVGMLMSADLLRNCTGSKT